MGGVEKKKVVPRQLAEDLAKKENAQRRLENSKRHREKRKKCGTQSA